ncbi:MAG: hypothetical protein HGA65_03970 [Oscillochloris sp.]|nr:hypothetical protein [Oscillochloris sp.]
MRHYRSTAAGAGTSYRLRITGTAFAGDAYESDNSADVARSITVGGASQHHTFHTPGDQDWVTFYAPLGYIYAIETANLASAVDTVLDLYNSNGALLASNDDYTGFASRVAYTSTTSQQLFVRVRHYNPVAGNPSLSYDIQVMATPTVAADSYENDNTSALATLVVPGTPNAPAQQGHNFNVPGDVDWISFQTVIGNVYTFETVNLESRCDTIITLIAPDGLTILTRDDDSGPGVGSRIVWTASSSSIYFLHVNHYNQSVGGLSTGYGLRVSTEGTAGTADAYEADNTSAAAKDISVNALAQNHTFHVAGDQDWVYFSARQGVEYTITTADLGTRADTVLELYDPTGTVRLSLNDDYSGYASRIVWTIPAPGLYRVRVYDYFSTVGGSNTNYTLRIIGNEGDNYEPDNASTTARSIVVNGISQTHTSHVAGDQDWVAFTANAGSTYTIATSNLASCSDTVLSLYSSDGSFLTYNDDYSGLASRIVWPVSTSGVLYVNVHQFNSGLAAACTAYDLRVTAVSAIPDAYEPDSTRAVALPITVNGSAQPHTFHLAGDQGWIRFNAVSGSTYTIATSDLGSCGDTVLELYNASNTLLAANDDFIGWASRIVWVATDTSTLFARVRHYRSDMAGSCTSYNLAVAGATIAPDAFEPDDTSVTATSFTVNGTAQTHTFHTTSDFDMVSFSAVANTTYTLYTSNLGTNADTVLVLYDSLGTTALASNDDYIGYGSQIVWTAPSTGDYLLLARPYGATGGRVSTNYDLAIRTGAAFAQSLPAPSVSVNLAGDVGLNPASGNQLHLTTVQVQGNLQVGSEFTTLIRATGRAASYKLNAGIKSEQLELVAVEPLDATGQSFDTTQSDSQNLWQVQQDHAVDLAVTQPWSTDQESTLLRLRWRVLAQPDNKLITLPIALTGVDSDGTAWQAGVATVNLPVNSEIKIESISPTLTDYGQPGFLRIRVLGAAGELPKVVLIDVQTSNETQLPDVSYAPDSSDTLIATIPADVKAGTYKLRLGFLDGSSTVSSTEVQLATIHVFLPMLLR